MLADAIFDDVVLFGEKSTYHIPWEQRREKFLASHPELAQLSLPVALSQSTYARLRGGAHQPSDDQLDSVRGTLCCIGCGLTHYEEIG